MVFKSRVFLIVFLILISISLGAPWWNSAWDYRKSINVTERSGESLENYQLKLNVNTESLISEGKMQSDCSDVRFTGSEDSSKLDYWIESGCNTQDTTLWVQKSSLAASSTEKIYMYYGNSDVVSESNRSATFTLWDDFGSSWDENWERTTSDVCIDGTTSDAVQYRPCTTNNYGSIQTRENILDPTASGYRFEYRWKRPDTAWSAAGIIAYTDGSSDHHSEATDGYRVKAGADVHCIDCSGGLSASSGMQLDTWDDSNNRWQVLDTNSFSIDDSSYNTMSFSIDDNDFTGSFNSQSRVSGTDNTWSGEKVALTAEDEDGPVYADYIEVRRYTSPEPSISLVEESSFSLCDKRGPKNECIANSTRDLSGESFEISSVFESLTFTHLTSFGAKTGLGVSNRSIISGIWEGSFNISSNDLKIKPGASFRPANERIILDERD